VFFCGTRQERLTPWGVTWALKSLGALGITLSFGTGFPLTPQPNQTRNPPKRTTRSALVLSILLPLSPPPFVRSNRAQPAAARGPNVCDLIRR